MISANQSTTVGHAQPDRLVVGGVQALVINGGLRNLSFGGVDVLRGLTYPVRDANWGTCPTRTLSEQSVPTADSVNYQHSFQALDGSFSGRFDLHIATLGSGAVVTATVEITAHRTTVVNRAGFTLLHPLQQVAGAPMTLRHPDGSTSRAKFPDSISPGQTAREMAALSHQIGPIAIDIAFEGDVFEMEDQRNWSDASFKTYCRPLAMPRPFTLHPDTPLRQKVVLTLARQEPLATTAIVIKTSAGRMPELALAHEPGLSDAAHLRDFVGMPVLARLTNGASDADLVDLRGQGKLTLELVATDLADLTELANRCRDAGLHPAFAVALPSAYLASHQPEGPWPKGETPDDFAKAMRQLFPAAAIGAGSMTNFTELNRCRPTVAAVDFVTFGNTAIVHAADDISVFETLEALPYIFASARALAGGRPLRLGLMSIGMRSNPYGAGVIANPDGARLPMAQDDPRQGTGFAAAYAVGILAAAALGGVESLALAMPGGPLGAGPASPLRKVIQVAARMAGQSVSVTQDRGWVTIGTPKGGLAANLTVEPLLLPEAGLVPPQFAVTFGKEAP